MSVSKLLSKIQYIDFVWDNRETVLSVLPHHSVVKFTIFCANQVFHLVDEDKKEVASKAIDLTKAFLVDSTLSHWRCIESSQETMLEVFKVLSQHADPDVNECAAALSACSYAVNSTTSQYRAPTSAKYCSSDAVYAMHGDAETAAEQMEYLEDLVLELLSPIEREAWLKGVKL
jgi:hypothetical protein